MKWLIVLCVCLALTACEQTFVTDDFIWKSSQGHGEDIIAEMKALGYTGKHDLMKLAGFIGVSGDISGSAGLFGSNITGSIGSASFVKFVWLLEGNKPFIDVLPFAIIDLQLDDTCEVPTIQYQYLPIKLHAHVSKWAVLHGEYSSWGGISSYPKVMKAMLPGQLIMRTNIARATITLSHIQLESRQYLAW